MTRGGIYGKIWPEPEAYSEGSGHTLPYILTLLGNSLVYAVGAGEQGGDSPSWKAGQEPSKDCSQDELELKTAAESRRG